MRHAAGYAFLMIVFALVAVLPGQAHTDEQMMVRITDGSTVWYYRCAPEAVGEQVVVTLPGDEPMMVKCDFMFTLKRTVTAPVPGADVIVRQ